MTHRFTQTLVDQQDSKLLSSLRGSPLFSLLVQNPLGLPSSDLLAGNLNFFKNKLYKDHLWLAANELKRVEPSTFGAAGVAEWYFLAFSFLGTERMGELEVPEGLKSYVTIAIICYIDTLSSIASLPKLFLDCVTAKGSMLYPLLTEYQQLQYLKSPADIRDLEFNYKKLRRLFRGMIVTTTLNDSEITAPLCRARGTKYPAVRQADEFITFIRESYLNSSSGSENFIITVVYNAIS